MWKNQLFYRISQWFGRFYKTEIFDFGEEKDVMKIGWALSQDIYQLRHADALSYVVLLVVRDYS